MPVTAAGADPSLAPADKFPTLAWLIDPLPVDTFLKAHWERGHVHGKRDDRDYYASLLSLETVEQHLTGRLHVGNALSLTRSGEPVPRDAYATEDGRIDNRRVAAEFGRGATIIFNQLNDNIPSLFDLCRRLEIDTGARAQTNIYLTPKNAQGFGAHYDGHDVFILQVHGTKRWKVYDAPIKAPLRGQRFQKTRHTPGEVVDTFDLHAGEFLYLPRGVMHEAVADDRLSLHITTGIIPITWNDLLFECLAAFNLTNENARHALPLGDNMAPDAMAEVERRAREIVAQFAGALDVTGAMLSLQQEIFLTRRAAIPGQLSIAADLDHVSVDSVMRRREGLKYMLVDRDEVLVLTSWGVQLELPAHAADAVRAALDPPTIRVGDLAGDLDDEGKVTLVRRLMREGLLQPA